MPRDFVVERVESLAQRINKLINMSRQKYQHRISAFGRAGNIAGDGIPLHSVKIMKKLFIENDFNTAIFGASLGGLIRRHKVRFTLAEYFDTGGIHAVGNQVFGDPFSALFGY